MIADVVVAARAVALASLAGPGSAADAWSDPVDPDLDGRHLIVACYTTGYDLSMIQLLAPCESVGVNQYLQRGLIVIGSAGRAGITVGKGYVVEPAGPVYAITEPDPTRWVSAYRPPTLLTTVLP